MTKRKLDEQDKSRENLKQQIKHTKDRIADTEFALDQDSMSQDRREELEEKNENRRKSIKQKQDDL